MTTTTTTTTTVAEPMSAREFALERLRTRWYIPSDLVEVQSVTPGSVSFDIDDRSLSLYGPVGDSYVVPNDGPWRPTLHSGADVAQWLGIEIVDLARAEAAARRRMWMLVVVVTLAVPAIIVSLTHLADPTAMTWALVFGGTVAVLVGLATAFCARTLFPLGETPIQLLPDRWKLPPDAVEPS